MARILVIDDSKLILHVAKTILSKQGHQVLLAEDRKYRIANSRNRTG